MSKMQLTKALLGGLLLASASSHGAERWYQSEHAQAGEPLFAEHCAACHGQQAQGAPNWNLRGADGRFPPPPLNGSAHMWHHPMRNLYGTIMRGQNNMPAFADKLNKAEVLAIIAWLQSHWPDEIYAAWLRLDEQSRNN